MSATAIRVIAVVNVSDNVRDRQNVGRIVEVMDSAGEFIAERVFLTADNDVSAAIRGAKAVIGENVFTDALITGFLSPNASEIETSSV